MATFEPMHRLRVYLSESDHWHGHPLYEAIVDKARELHLAGATVLRGPLGFGAKSHIHKAALLHVSESLPLIVEIVDRRERIEQLLPHLDAMMTDGLATLEPVEAIRYRRDSTAHS